MEYNLVVIPCGGKKQNHRTAAGEMYQGPYFKSCLRYAQTLISRNKILILSAKYGFLRLTDVIDPYEMTLGDHGCVTTKVVIEQAARMGVDRCMPVVLGGKRYVGLCKQVWRHAVTPVPSVGIGKQMQWMKNHAGRLT